MGESSRSVRVPSTTRHAGGSSVSSISPSSRSTPSSRAHSSAVHGWRPWPRSARSSASASAEASSSRSARKHSASAGRSWSPWRHTARAKSTSAGPQARCACPASASMGSAAAPGGGSSATRCAKPSARAGSAARASQDTTASPPSARPATSVSRDSRRRATSATPTSTGWPLVISSPTTPANPPPRRSTISPAGPGGRSCPAASSRRSDPVPERAVLAERADLAGLGVAKRAHQDPRLLHPLPAIALEPEHDVVGSSRGGSESRGPSRTPRPGSASHRRSRA